MNLSHVRVVVPLLAAVSLLTFACASPPEVEKKAADAAVSTATAAGADKYAPSEFSAMAAAGKAAARAEAEKQISDLEGRWKELQGKAEAAAKKLKPTQKAAWDKVWD